MENKKLAIGLFSLVVLVVLALAFDMIPQALKPEVNLENNVAIDLSSKRLKVEEETDEPYLVFDSEDQEARTLHVTNDCPVKDWVELGQWTVVARNDSLKLQKVPFEAFRGPSASPKKLADEYKVSLSSTLEYKEDPIKTYEFLPRGKMQFMGVLNTTLEEDQVYYITLEAKEIVATPDHEAHVRILSYDHPNLNDTILGTFSQAGTRLSRKDSDLRFEDVNLDLKIDVKPSNHPDPVCKQAFYNYLKRLRSLRRAF